MINVFYFGYINVIGGIEQFFAYMTEKYQMFNITILYKDGDIRQLNRLRKFAKIKKYNENEHLECENLFVCFNREVLDTVSAKHTYLILHGDYEAMMKDGSLDYDDLPIDDRVDEYIGVSKVVCDSWTRLTGIPCKLIYNPIVLQPKKKLLKLVYCGRLTKEKGGDLVKTLIEELDHTGIDYLLYVYSNVRMFGDNHIVYMDTRLDAGQFLNKDNFDFIIVPSKNEGYCYSLIQALANGLPAIITPCPVFKELGANDTNSITIEFDGNNIPSVIDRLYDKFDFEYMPMNDTWNELLLDTPDDYVPPKELEVVSLVNYFDMDLMQDIHEGDTYKVSEHRADLLLSRGYVKLGGQI